MTGYLTTASPRRCTFAFRRECGSSPAAAWSLEAGNPGQRQEGRPIRLQLEKPGFPGTVIAGRYVDPVTAGPGNVKIYLTVSHQASGNELAHTAAKEYDFFTDSFGASESSHLNVVELPNDTLPAVWAPELAAIMGSRVETRAASGCWPIP